MCRPRKDSTVVLCHDSKSCYYSSKTVILPPTIETSDRIIRHYKDHREHFLRVQFTDENEKLSLANGANHLSLFYRVYRTLETELRLEIGYEIVLLVLCLHREIKRW